MYDLANLAWLLARAAQTHLILVSRRKQRETGNRSDGVTGSFRVPLKTLDPNAVGTAPQASMKGGKIRATATTTHRSSPLRVELMCPR